jgi:hypothetical protein
MLEYVGNDTFIATCDRCAAASPAIMGIRELAIARLMLQRWHLRTSDEGTSAVCPTCRPSTLPAVAPRSRPTR